MKDKTIKKGRNVEALRAAELALYSSKRILEDYQFQRAQGWDTYWTPEITVKHAARCKDVSRLVWC